MLSSRCPYDDMFSTQSAIACHACSHGAILGTIGVANQHGALQSAHAEREGESEGLHMQSQMHLHVHLCCLSHAAVGVRLIAERMHACGLHWHFVSMHQQGFAINAGVVTSAAIE